MQRNRILRGLVFSCLVFGLLIHPFAASSESEQEVAIAAAEEWIALVDQEKYAESWKQASSLVQNAVPEKDWGTQMRAARTPFGKVLSRKVGHVQFAESLPGAPDGKYYVIQFVTRFEKKANAVETITPMLEGGTWKVSGYYIH